MLDERFVFIGVALVVIGGYTYIVDTIKGRARPNRVTWFLLSIAPLIAFAGELSEDVGLRSLATLSVGLVPAAIFIASFVNKKSYWELHRMDYVYGSLSVLGLILWLLTGEGNVAIALAILADGLAVMPTVIKAYHEPESESRYIWFACIINAVIALLVVEKLTFANIGFPVYLLVSCSIVAVFVQYKPGLRLASKKA